MRRGNGKKGGRDGGGGGEGNTYSIIYVGVISIIAM